MTDQPRRMGIANMLADIADALSADAVDEAVALARAHVASAPTVTIPFGFTTTERDRVATASKVPTLRPADKLRIYERDGFIDRYSPERWRLVNPGALRVLSLRLGPAMATELSKHNIPAKYATNSPVWFDMWPAVDHVDARTYGGTNAASNLITCSWWRNAAKGSRALDETGWEVQQPGSLAEWDGLTTWFRAEVERDPQLLEDPMVRNWHLPAGRSDAGAQGPSPRRAADERGERSGPAMRRRARGSGEGPTTAESAPSTFDELLTSAPDDAHRALGYLTQWAEDNGLTSYDTTTSRVFALPPRRGVIWFFVPTHRSTRELELDLKKLRSVDSAAARDVLTRLDELGLSPSTDYPRIPHRALVRRWEAVRDQVLEPYLAACRAA